MENQNFTQKTLFNFEVDNNVKIDIAEAAKWAKFLAIIGFITMGLMLLGGVAFITGASSSLGNVPGMETWQSIGGITAFGVFYLLMAAIYIYPVWHLYKFGVLIRESVRTSDQLKFNNGIKHLKRMFKFFGVFTIVFIALYAVAIIGMVIFFATGKFNF